MTSIHLPEPLAPFSRVLEQLAGELDLELAPLRATIRLLHEGHAPATIACDHAAVTGGLPESTIETIRDRWNDLVARESKRAGGI